VETPSPPPADAAANAPEPGSQAHLQAPPQQPQAQPQAAAASSPAASPGKGHRPQRSRRAAGGGDVGLSEHDWEYSEANPYQLSRKPTSRQGATHARPLPALPAVFLPACGCHCGVWACLPLALRPTAVVAVAAGCVGRQPVLKPRLGSGTQLLPQLLPQLPPCLPRRCRRIRTLCHSAAAVPASGGGAAGSAAGCAADL
jgi:hypothetical protein